MGTHNLVSFFSRLYVETKKFGLEYTVSDDYDKNDTGINGITIYVTEPRKISER